MYRTHIAPSHMRDAVLLIRDHHMARAAGHHAQVELV
jgi:hypothetical protein